MKKTNSSEILLPRINRFNKNTIQYYKTPEILEHQTGLKIENLISWEHALIILKLAHNEQHWLKDKILTGIIKVFRIRRTKDFILINKIRKYYEYYLPEDIELLKYIKNNGILILRDFRTKKYGLEKSFHNPPYYFIVNKNKHYIFINNTQKIKTCISCYLLKTFDNFYQYRNKNIEHSYRPICIECSLKRSNKRYKNLTLTKKQKQLKKNKIWKKNNKEKVKSYKNNIKNKIRKNIRKRVQDVISNFIKYKKIIDCINNSHFARVSVSLGCNYKDFLLYLESKFLPGMSWENYGPGYEIDNQGKPVYKYGKIKLLKQWSIDHIKCVDSFNLNDPAEIIKINHYTNLLPMWDNDNSIKGNKIELCPINNKELLQKYPDLQQLTIK